jgi:hypothetical protein
MPNPVDVLPVSAALARHLPRLTFRRASKGVNTPRSPSGGDVAKRLCSRRWAARATASTTRCVSPSSPRSNSNCSRACTSTRANRPGGRSSPDSKAGTTSVGYTAASATAHRSSSKPCRRKPKPYRTAGCPPPAGVMVVTGDPPPGRGQPATQRSRETKSRINIPTADLSVETGQLQ